MQSASSHAISSGRREAAARFSIADNACVRGTIAVNGG
jgi:hypothetical protein